MDGRKLKVFQAQFGFYDTVVAAPIQAAALRAWGVNQNLFASGEARVTTDEAVVAAATAQPETPLRRAVGSTDLFALELSGLPKVPDTPRKPAAKPVAKTTTPPAPARPPPNRSKLDGAEKALRALDDQRKGEEADLRREMEELETRKAAAQAAYVDARKTATAKVVEARTARLVSCSCSSTIGRRWAGSSMVDKPSAPNNLIRGHRARRARRCRL